MAATEEFNLSSGDVDRNIETLRQCKIIPESDVRKLCEKAKEILGEEENVHHGAFPLPTLTAPPASPPHVTY